MSTDRDWERELAKIDQQLASVSDEALAASARGPAAAPPAAPPGPPRPAARRRGARGDAPTPAGVLLRLLLAVALGVGILFWPYANRCGLGLAGYLAAVAAVAGAGCWTAVTTWRARSGRAHVLPRPRRLGPGARGDRDPPPHRVRQRPGAHQLGL
jgi:hypothetical protein